MSILCTLVLRERKTTREGGEGKEGQQGQGTQDSGGRNEASRPAGLPASRCPDPETRLPLAFGIPSMPDAGAHRTCGLSRLCHKNRSLGLNHYSDSPTPALGAGRSDSYQSLGRPSAAAKPLYSTLLCFTTSDKTHWDHTQSQSWESLKSLGEKPALPPLK